MTDCACELASRSKSSVEKSFSLRRFSSFKAARRRFTSAVARRSSDSFHWTRSSSDAARAAHAARASCERADAAERMRILSPSERSLLRSDTSTRSLRAIASICSSSAMRWGGGEGGKAVRAKRETWRPEKRASLCAPRPFARAPPSPPALQPPPQTA